MICGIDYMAGVVMEENLLADKVKKLLQYIESSMRSPKKHRQYNYYLHTK